MIKVVFQGDQERDICIRRPMNVSQLHSSFFYSNFETMSSIPCPHPFLALGEDIYIDIYIYIYIYISLYLYLYLYSYLYLIYIHSFYCFITQIDLGGTKVLKRIKTAGEASPAVNQTARNVTKFLIKVSADGVTYEDFDAVRGS